MVIRGRNSTQSARAGKMGVLAKVGIKEAEALLTDDSPELNWAGKGLVSGDLEELATIVSGSTLTVQKLVLFENAIGDQGVAVLCRAAASFPRLTYLDLDNSLTDAIFLSPTASTNTTNHVGDSGLAALTASFTALQELHLRGNHVGEAGADALISWLGGASGGRLVSLNLLANRFGVEAAHRLSAWARQQGKRTLCGHRFEGEAVSFAGMDLSEADGVLIAASIESQGPLEHVISLDLHENMLGDAAIAALSRALAVGALPSLAVLSLNDNSVTDLSPLAETLAARPSVLDRLEKLLLRENQVDKYQT